MSNKKRPDELLPAGTDKKKKNGSGMTGYLKKLIPSKAIIDFVLKEDFDKDGLEEAIVGYTELIPFPPASYVVWLKIAGTEIQHVMLLSDPNLRDVHTGGIFDNVAAVDVDNDGFPELVLSLSAGNGHYITVNVFDWINGEPLSLWKSIDPCYHGSMEVLDVDNDGVYEIVTDSGTMDGKELLAFEEVGYHVRKSCYYKWDGNTFKDSAFEVRMPYLSYNCAVLFLQYIWQQNYSNAYEMVLMPGFMGLNGLDDSSLSAFKKYINKYIRPVLRHNLSRGRLVPSEPYDSFCLFSGFYDDLAIELVKKNNRIYVQSLNIHKKI